MAFTIRLTSDDRARLDALAERTGRTASFHVRTAVRAYLDDLEDADAADSAIREFETSTQSSRPLAELIADLGITTAELDHAEEELRTVDDR